MPITPNPPRRYEVPFANSRLPEWLIAIRVPILVALHVAVFSAAYLISFAIRFDLAIPPAYWSLFWRTIPVMVAIQVGTFWVFNTIHGWWRYVTFRDLISFVKPLVLGSLIFLIYDLILPQQHVPRSILIIHFLLSGLMISLIRSSWRFASEFMTIITPEKQADQRAFMISNHHDTLVLANQINSQPRSNTKIVGILSVGNYRRGTERAGIPILGTPADAPALAARFNVDQVWLVAGSIPGPDLATLKAHYDQHGLKTQVIPSATDRNPSASFIPVREIDINDLLQREPIVLDQQKISQELSGRRVMVTGAGGSIGSELCRQLLRFNPSQLMLVDHRENSVFLIHNELSSRHELNTELIPAVGDILDHDRMERLFMDYRPEFVYHAAAHKHVGLMEISPGEAIKNNILGTKQIAELADQFGVHKFVFISTDKAVNPSSVMGCTKQIAERFVLAKKSHSKTRYVVVRFGNVLGSNGSVVPIFKDQISRGGPITITDPKMTRYFMTIPEASQLVLQAANMGQGGEIFVLDMGEPVKIVDLAKKMIRLAGLPENAIDIRFTGARPGEKLYEELYFEDEETIPTAHKKIFAAWHRELDFDTVVASIHELTASTDRPADQIKTILKKIVPEYLSTDSAESRASATFSYFDSSSDEDPGSLSEADLFVRK